MKPRKTNLDWMRKLLADLEGSRSDPRIADLMEGLSGPSPSVAANVELDLDIVGCSDVVPSAPASRRPKR
jgi:hypothetical protein